MTEGQALSRLGQETASQSLNWESKGPGLSTDSLKRQRTETSHQTSHSGPLASARSLGLPAPPRQSVPLVSHNPEVKPKFVIPDYFSSCLTQVRNECSS